jgi:hypothetical protein
MPAPEGSNAPAFDPLNPTPQEDDDMFDGYRAAGQNLPLPPMASLAFEHGYRNARNDMAGIADDEQRLLAARRAELLGQKTVEAKMSENQDVRLSFSGQPMPPDGIEGCVVCGQPFKEGDMVLIEVNEGEAHTACCGPERDGYVNLDTGEPIGPDEPIPTGYPWKPSNI